MATLYEYYNTGDDSVGSVLLAHWEAQTFTPSAAHKITSVKLKLFRSGSPGILTVGIRATDVNGHPTGADLCSGTIDGNTLTTDPAGAWYEITLGAGCVLASTKYAIVIRISGGDIGNYVAWLCDITSPTYAGGCRESSEDSGGTWESVSYVDFMFEDWGVPLTEILRPNDAGYETAITSQNPASTYHWDKVDEVTPDGDTTCVYMQVASYQRDLYNLPAHSVGSGTINSITIYFCVGNHSADQAAYAKPSQRSGTTTTDGTEVTKTGAVSYQTFSQTYTINPATGLPYTWDEIDALQVGVCLKSVSASYIAKCTQVYVEVAYTPVTQAYKDIATRFKLWVRNYKDMATRFGLIVQAYKDTSTRFKLWARGFQDVTTRFKLFVQGYRNIGSRFKLTVQVYQDIAARFKLTVQAYQDITTRFKLIAQTYRDIATKFKLTVQTYQDVSTRFYLYQPTWKELEIQKAIAALEAKIAGLKRRPGAHFEI
jgi:hypothetical protein